VDEKRVDSWGDEGDVTRPPPPVSVLERTTVSGRDRLFRVACCSGGSELAELSGRLDLSMDLGAPAFSLSVAVVDDMAFTSVSETEETKRAACEAVRGRAVECGGITWMGYGDS